ncbi:M50 family metallopeptidase [Halomontanus rarus]|uniref:M50 family metallopeptidase n=1 Tax=Halomontanus rarus TaxID=3034020 RepID=UPI001A99DB21
MTDEMPSETARDAETDPRTRVSGESVSVSENDRESSADGRPRLRRDFGFTWGETGETIWLRNDDGDYKRIEPAFLDPLLALARGERDPETAGRDVLRAVELLADEGYLEAGGEVTRYEPPSDIRLWPRLAVLGAATVAMCALIATRWSAIWRPPGSVTGTVLIGPFFIVVTLLHELGHYVASRPYFTPRIRLDRLNGVIPAVVTRTNDAWRCPRTVRIWISLAGPAVDVAITLGLAAAFVSSPEYGLLGTLILVQLFRLLFVLNPLVEGDGYWLLVDVFETHNLRPHAFRDLRRGRPTAPAAFAVSIVAFTGGFVLASGYFLLQVVGLV